MQQLNHSKKRSGFKLLLTRVEQEADAVMFGSETGLQR